MFIRIVKKSGLVAVTFALLLAVSACGGSGSSREGQTAPSVNANESALRVMNGSDRNGAITILVNNQPIETLGPGESFDYIDYQPGEHVVTVFGAEGTRAEGQLLAEAKFMLEGGTAYTFAVTGVNLGIAGFLYTDSTERTGEGAFKLRLISTSTLLEPVDMYFIGLDQVDIEDELPVFQNLSYGTASEYVVTAVGDYQVVLAQAGTKNIVTRIPVFQPPSESIVTLYAIERQGIGGPFQIIEVIEA